MNERANPVSRPPSRGRIGLGLTVGIAVALLLGVTALVLRALLGPVGDALGARPPTPIPPRTVRDIPSGIAEVWRRSGIYLPNLPGPPGMIADRAGVYYVGFAETARRPRLEAISHDSGSQLWLVEDRWPFHGIASDGTSVFVASAWRLHAYSADRGRLAWETGELPDHTSYRLYPVDRTGLLLLSIDDRAGGWKQVIRLYDPPSGLILRVTELEVEPGSELRYLTEEYELWANRSDLWKLGISDRRTAWKVTLGGPTRDWPLVVNSTIIVAAGNPARAMAVSLQDGHELWRLPDLLVSNIALALGGIIAVREDASVIRIDPETGNSKVLATFGGPITEDLQSTLAYWVAGSADELVVYFGDSQEVVALGSLGP